MGEDEINLSGGQKQLIALARALYKQPQLLLLDEATAAVDKKMEDFVVNLLNAIKEETAVILVSNRAQVVRKAGYIYMLDKGEAIVHGKHEELIKYKNLYSESFAAVVANTELIDISSLS